MSSHAVKRALLAGTTLLGAALLSLGSTGSAFSAEPDVLWLKGPSPLLSPYRYPIRVDYSPDGAYLAVTHTTFTEIRRATDQQLLFTLPESLLYGRAFPPDGGGILTRFLNFKEKTVSYHTWNPETRELLNTLTLRDPHTSLISPSGQTVFERETVSETDLTPTSIRAYRVRDSRLLAAVEAPRNWGFSSDDRAFFIVTKDNVLRIMKMEDGSPLGEIPGSALPGDIFPIYIDLTLSPVGDFFLLSRPDRVELRALSDGRLLQSFPGQNRALFSPDGHFLVTSNIIAGQNGITLWKRENGTWVPAFSPAGSYRAPMFSPDGRYLAVQDLAEMNVKVLRADTGQVHRAFPEGIPQLFSPDGETLVIALGPIAPPAFSRPDRRISFWRVADGREIEYPDGINVKSDPNWENVLAFSPDGHTLAVAGSDVQLRDARRGTLLRSWPVGDGELRKIEFSPDGKTLTAEFFPDQTRTWRVTDGTVVREGKAKPRIASPDGRFYALGAPPITGAPVEIRRVSDDSLVSGLSTPEGVLTPLAFTPDGSSLLVINFTRKDLAGKPLFTFELWDVEGGRFLRTVASQLQPTNGVPEWRSDGRTLAFIRSDISNPSSSQTTRNTLYLYDVESEALIRSEEYTYAEGSGMYPLTIQKLESPTTFTRGSSLDLERNLYLTYREADRTLSLRELTTGRVLQAFRFDAEAGLPHTPGLAQFTPDRQFLVTRTRQQVVFWRVADGQLAAVLKGGELHQIRPPDYPTAGPLTEFVEYGGEVYQVDPLVFSPDGGLMAYLEYGEVLVAATNPAGGGFLPGDVDVNFRVEVTDAVMALRIIVGLADPTLRETRAADINTDASVTVSDVILILRKSINLPD